MIRKLTPARRSRTGRLHVYTRAEKTGIALVPLVAAAAVWILVPDVALRLVLIALLALVLPALVVVVLGRRS
jgi:multisubunit Na+/H+ antiporter MnhG subunit